MIDSTFRDRVLQNIHFDTVEIIILKVYNQSFNMTEHLNNLN